MGLLTSLLTFPVSGPVAGIEWSLRQVQRIVDEELTDDAPIKEELMELQLRLEAGDISDAEYVQEEARLMTRLREVREWRERLGRETSGGPVRVARSDDADAPAADAPGADAQGAAAASDGAEPSDGA